MDSFDGNTEFIKAKRSFDSFIDKDSSLTFGIVRHNLLQDFEETPAKALKVSAKRPFSSVATPGLGDSAALKKQLTARDAEIITLKANITHLENRFSSMEVASRHARIEHDRELAKFKSEKDREAAKASELRSKLQYVMEKEKNSREDLQKLEQELHKQKIEADKKLLAVQREKLESDDKAQQSKAKWLETESELRRQILSHLHEISDLQSKYEESRAQLDLRKSVQVENSEQQKQVKQLQAALKEEQDKNKDMEQRLIEHQDNIVITKALKSDLDMVPSMKNELERLRLDNEQLRHNEQNTLLLEEEVRSLKKKLERAEAAYEHVTELKVENEELQGRLHRWEAADTSGSRRPQSPSSLCRKIQELETSRASLALSQGEVQSSIKITQRKLEQIQAENSRLAANLAAQKATESQLNDLVRRLKRKLLLVSKERDSYKSLLDSYESEVTMNFDAERKSLIQNLELTLQGYKDHSAEMESEIARLNDRIKDVQSKNDQAQLQLQKLSSSEQQVSSKEDQDTIKQLQEKLAELENNFLKCEEEKNTLEARIEQRHLQGDYDPSKTKIIHFTMNPCAIAQEARQKELERLKEENETLHKRNQILEEHGGRIDDITMQVQEKLQAPSPSKEVEEMKSQLKREEMRNKRLMEIFKKTSQELREICYCLTGYKIDIPCSNQYRLSNMYAESSKDYLLFQQDAQGEIQMLETDYSTTLQDAIEMYLQRQNSIPMFLSHITMDLFSKRTLNLG